ncbi:MAG: SDR family NAD(P)-dependent oxidoreductase, partial [Kiritimatiellae bacterium]|nr:SDR family NAD(P)-dependent oxidoreductase [Kiritimatiellia bacterium]
MKTVLVTGGTVRIGKAVADRLRSDGWRVITSSSRAGAGADIAADLSDPMGPARLYAACLRLLGGNPPDAIVNNAGLFTGDEATLR